jgi:murein DD-endopeptidase MepM/ murein hydrolase activator NlpD
MLARCHLVLLALAAGAIPAIAAAQEQAAAVEIAWEPSDPEQGSLVVLGVRTTRGDSIEAVAGTMAGEPLHFERGPTWFRALGAVPLSAAGHLAARLVVRRPGGRRDTVLAHLPVRVRRVRHERLRADPALVQPPDSVAPRLRAESALLMAIKRDAQETPRLWVGPFVRPRRGSITDGFGVARVFNGAVRSRHLGVDFAGRVGDPVHATNRGVVVLTDPLYFSGTTVFINHGAGLLTAYLHLSRVDVAVGDTVSAGQLIGRVGATGRVTGPHLHWLATYGQVMVDPLDLLRLRLDIPLHAAPAPAAALSASPDSL